MSGQEESGSEKGPPEGEGSASQAMAPSAHALDYRAAPLHDARSMMHPMQGMASSPPVEGGGGHNIAGSPPVHHPAPPIRRIDQQVTTATATAVTPDSRQFAPPGMMSPPYATMRHSPGRGPTIMSVSPTKRSGRSGESSHRGVFRSIYFFVCDVQIRRYSYCVTLQN